MPIAGPWYLAWVDKTDTTFDPSRHLRMDEYVFSIVRTLAEGQKPGLEVEMKNPRVGLLNASRKFWVWVSRYNPTTDTIEPFFFGRVLGSPSDLQGEVITVQFVTWPEDYLARVQLVAESMKVLPFYDPVAIDVQKRDDPDTILEGYTKLWGVDPITGVVTADDVIVGDDGNVNFTADDHFYDGMQMSIGQPPLTAIRIDGTANWTQTGRGVIDIGNRIFITYSGDGMIADWPKPLQQLQSGYSVQYANAVDALGVASAVTATVSWSWQNHEKVHAIGDAMSMSVNATIPQVSAFKSGILSANAQSGVLDPYAVDSDGEPSPLNIPMSLDISTIYAAKWQVNTSLVLRYDAERPHSERITIIMTADVQPTIVDPTVAQETEVITKNCGDVGVPLILLRNWTTIAGQPVDVGDVIFPDNPSLPGAQVAQRCTVAGTAGLEQPDFSDVPGVTTVDGGVTWASLGTASPTDSAPDWTGVSHVNASQIIRPREPFWTTWYIFTQSGRASFPRTGVGASLGQVIQSSNGSFHVCTQAGETNSFASNPVEPAFGTTWGSTVSDGTAIWTCLGTRLPDGTRYYMAIGEGTTGAEYVIPPFPLDLHQTVTDNGITWINVGTGDIPAGGTSTNVSAYTYFPRDRGMDTVRYFLCCGRAKLMYRSRCVDTTFDTTFDKGLAVTMRKTCTLHDYRLPGGIVLGKTKRVVHSVNGDNGTETCRITIGSCVGYGNAVTEVPGEEEYVDDEYVEDPYQTRDSATEVLDVDSSVGYVPLVPVPDDDGLVLPLTRSQVVAVEEVHGTLADQEGGISSAFASAARATRIGQGSDISTLPSSFGGGNFGLGGFGQQEQYSIYQQQQQALAGADSVGFELKMHPIWYDLQLKPINRQFNKVYALKTTPLTIEQGIDLGGATT